MKLAITLKNGLQFVVYSDGSTSLGSRLKALTSHWRIPEGITVDELFSGKLPKISAKKPLYAAFDKDGEVTINIDRVAHIEPAFSIPDFSVVSGSHELLYSGDSRRNADAALYHATEPAELFSRSGLVATNHAAFPPASR